MPAESLNRFGHLALEGEPAHLSIGDDLKPRLLLQGDGIVDRLVLDALELGVGNRAGGDRLARRH